MKKFLGIIMASAIIASMIGCDTKKDDSSKNTLLLLILDQMSGNCVTITKSSSILYNAAGTKLPKAVCNDTSKYTTDSAAAKAQYDAFTDANVANITGVGTNCAALATAMTTGKASVTAANIEAVAGYGCTAVVPDPKGILYYCKTQTAVDSAKAFTASSTRWIAVSDVTVDMSVNLAAQKTAQTTAMAGTGFSAAAIAALTPMDVAFANIATSIRGTIVRYSLSGYFATYGACATEIMAADADVKSQFTRLVGLGGAAIGIVAADAAAVTSVVSNSILCSYGSSFTTATSTVGVCPTTYPTW